MSELRAELTDGAGNAPPEWYLRKLVQEEQERAALPPPPAPVPIIRDMRPKHVGHVLEWVRTLVPCAVLCVQLLILYRQ